MYADRHQRPGFQPGSLAVSLAITGAMIAGLIFSAPKLVAPTPETHLRLDNVPLDPPPPPPDPPKPMPRTQAPRTVVTAPTPEVVIPLLPPVPAADPTPTLPDPVGTASDAPPKPAASPVAPPPPLPALPALVAASVDPRFADALQPPYPPEERRANREGRATVRVLIGVDGRVRQVERVSADSDAFFAATQHQALARWRFRPATRGGIPVESWRTMSVRFVLEDG